MGKMRALERKVSGTIRKYGMFSNGDHVLVAVSGGADSTALLHSLIRLAPSFRLRLTVAHLNHGIRGAEADADQEFVRRVCRELALPFVTETAQLGAATRNMEQLARNARYSFLRRTAASVGAQKVAVGHTMNDQAETVLLRVLRGSGADGLAAIHPVVDNLIIRPLLECTRLEVTRYLETLGVGYCEDSTNRNMEFQRNRARYELAPYLEARFNPRLVETLAREAELSREIADYLDGDSRRAYESLRRPIPEGISMPVERLLGLHPAIRKLVVRHGIRDCQGSLAGITGRQVQDVERLCRGNRSGRRILLPNHAVALREFGNLLILKRRAGAAVRFCCKLTVPGACTIPEIGMRIVASFQEPPGSPPARQDAARQALLDPVAVPKVLTIRSRLPGDRYGGTGHRKVKKMLIDAKIPSQTRDRLPVVVAGDAVVWIPGFKPAKSFAVHPSSCRCILLQCCCDE